MNLTDRIKSEFARALRNFRYERTPWGILFPQSRAGFGGYFSVAEGDGPLVPCHNTVAYEGLDDILNCYFNAGGAPSGFYLAPFTNNVAPSSSLTAATFASQQGEYTGYTQSTRVPWTSNGASSGQSVSNSNAPGTFTVGSSAVNVTGAGFIAGAATKGGTTGKMIAAALFDVPNSLNPASTLKIQYSLGAVPNAG